LRISEAAVRHAYRVLVGYDGSPAARAAVAYAFERVGSEGVVVVAYVASPPHTQWSGTRYSEGLLDRHREYGRRVLDTLLAEAGGRRLRTELAEGPTAATLVRLAEDQDAEEIVVGSRGFGPMRAMLGSVSHALLHEMDRPTVVIPARTLRAPRDHRVGRIVVGYDGSPTAKDALAHAAHRAGSRGRLIVVYVYESSGMPWPSPLSVQASAESRELGEQMLAALDDEWPGGVPVERELREGPAAPALAQAAHDLDADEIVVGSRGLGRFRAALGSVSHALVHDAEQPVVVVPQSAVAEQEESERRRHRDVHPRDPWWI